MRNLIFLSLVALMLPLLTACQTVDPEKYAELPAIQIRDAAEGGRLVTLKTRPLVTQKIWYAPANNPRAAIIIIKGGDGILRIGPKFVLTGPNRTRRTGWYARRADLFLDQGITLVLVDVPSDHPDGISRTFRRSREHVKDIEKVINYIKRELNVPVWFMGHSNASISAANIAISSKEKIDGVIFASSITESRTPITGMNLKKITVPVLAISDKFDSCPSTPPSGAEEIIELVTASPVARAKIFSNVYIDPKTTRRGSSCQGGNHSFKKIRGKVARYVAKFILENSK